MVNLDQVKEEILDKLLVLNPHNIILFGSYANGTPSAESDIDLFIMIDDIRPYQLKARQLIRELIPKYSIGFDILVSPTNEVLEKTDYFYRVDILQNGVVLYEHTNLK